MLTTKRIRAIQELAIAEMRLSKSEDTRIHPQVGAVIVDGNGHVIAKAHRGEDKGGHAEYLAINKALQAGFRDFESAAIFATLEPCSRRNHGKTACMVRIVQMGFKRVFIGMLDPNPAIATHSAFFFPEKGVSVEHFPGELTEEIRQANNEFIGLFREKHLPPTSFYVAKRISETVHRKLKAERIDIETIPSAEDFSIRDLAAYVASVSRMKASEVHQLLGRIRSEAFDEKYCTYGYELDARSIRFNWKREVEGILKKQFNIFDFKMHRVICIGIGNGLEGVDWLEQFEGLIGIDIGPKSLEICGQRLPRAQLFACAAERLDPIGDASQDVYISLRTYQSSYFDVEEAIREAYRVLVPGGVIIISVSNAYLEEGALIRGMLPRGSSHVDTDKAHELIARIRRDLSKLKFDGIGVHTGKVEEFVFAKKRR